MWFFAGVYKFSGGYWYCKVFFVLIEVIVFCLYLISLVSLFEARLICLSIFFQHYPWVEYFCYLIKSNHSVPDFNDFIGLWFFCSCVCGKCTDVMLTFHLVSGVFEFSGEYWLCEFSEYSLMLFLLISIFYLDAYATVVNKSPCCISICSSSRSKMADAKLRNMVRKTLIVEL